MIRHLDDFPFDTLGGGCLLFRDVQAGRCVDLGLTSDDIAQGRRLRLVLSEHAVRGMAGSMGMIDEAVHSVVTARVDELEDELAAANEKIAALLGALAVFGIPVPDQPESKPKRARTKKVDE